MVTNRMPAVSDITEEESADSGETIEDTEEEDSEEEESDESEEERISASEQLSARDSDAANLNGGQADNPEPTVSSLDRHRPGPRFSIHELVYSVLVC
jgi:hypothetical protein